MKMLQLYQFIKQNKKSPILPETLPSEQKTKSTNTVTAALNDGTGRFADNNVDYRYKMELGFPKGQEPTLSCKESLMKHKELLEEKIHLLVSILDGCVKSCKSLSTKTLSLVCFILFYFPNKNKTKNTTFNT